MLIWRYGSVRRLTWTSPDQHRFTAGRPYMALKSTLMTTWLSADQQASWSAELSERTFHGCQREKTCRGERSIVNDVTRLAGEPYLITVWTVVQAVLTATFNSYGDRQISTPYKINTREPINKKFGTVDYVRERTLYTKFDTNPPTGGFWANG